MPRGFRSIPAVALLSVAGGLSGCGGGGLGVKSDRAATGRLTITGGSGYNGAASLRADGTSEAFLDNATTGMRTLTLRHVNQTFILRYPRQIGGQTLTFGAGGNASATYSEVGTASTATWVATGGTLAISSGAVTTFFSSNASFVADASATSNGAGGTFRLAATGEIHE